MVDVNLTGVFHTVRASLPALVARNGYVLIVASVASSVPAPGQAAYAATKAGVEQLANVLRLEPADFLAGLPAPTRTTTSPAVCAARCATAIDGRPRRVDVPRWLGVARWVKPLLATAVDERPLARRAERFAVRAARGV